VQRSSRSERIESFLEKTNSILEMTCTYRSDKVLGRLSAVAGVVPSTWPDYRWALPSAGGERTTGDQEGWTKP